VRCARQGNGPYCTEWQGGVNMVSGHGSPPLGALRAEARSPKMIRLAKSTRGLNVRLHKLSKLAVRVFGPH
jgi:hypothetical protein